MGPKLLIGLCIHWRLPEEESWKITSWLVKLSYTLIPLRSRSLWRDFLGIMTRSQSTIKRDSNLYKITFLVILTFMLTKMYISWRGTQINIQNFITENDFLETDVDLSELLQDYNSSANSIDSEEYFDKEITDKNIKTVIKELKEQIKTELNGYKLPSFRDTEDLFHEKGGTPMRSLVITTWRSGSTFIGGVLNSHPATFHYSEPLTEFKTVQVRGEPLAGVAVNTLRNLLNCNYHRLEPYLKRSRNYRWLFTHNTRFWEHCKQHLDLCWEPHFLRPVCRLFPFQSMKVVHIRLRLIEELLADPKMNVRVVYLMRDPRAVMRSRYTFGWCKKSADCGDPTNVCADYVDDYGAALRFTKLFPETFKVVRYEDMSLNPDEVVPDIFKFFGLRYHKSVKEFIKLHTTTKENNKYGTYRNSSETALIWRTKLKFSIVEQLQETCRVALSAWGYLPADNASHLLTLNPLVQPFQLP